MMLYGDGQYHILTSTNLLSWQDEHHPIKDSFECPDFFELPVDGDRSQMKWVADSRETEIIPSALSTAWNSKKKAGGIRAMSVRKFLRDAILKHNTDTGDGRRIQTAWMRGVEISS